MGLRLTDKRSLHCEDSINQCGGNRRHEYNNNIEHRKGFANLFQMSSIICGATNIN